MKRHLKAFDSETLSRSRGSPQGEGSSEVIRPVHLENGHSRGLSHKIDNTARTTIVETMRIDYSVSETCLEWSSDWQSVATLGSCCDIGGHKLVNQNSESHKLLPKNSSKTAAESIRVWSASAGDAAHADTSAVRWSRSASCRGARPAG